MSIQAGSRLGCYEIIALLGVGGMGEVYRARDTRLGRFVAVKVLPRELTADADRIERFAREARILAALNHRNIATIHGIEDTDENQALVMELVDGETLDERFARSQDRAVPLTETLDIARQIADALDAAHERGIVHRDLKPSNVMISTAGIVKLLDFGLAKVHTDAPATDLTNATMTAGPTQYGTLLGTAPYMSPEQARGQPVDKRADIWAFGCVLYELLTGRRAFGGETNADVLAAVLERAPDWDAVPATTPPAVKRLLQRCLDRDPKRRLRDIGDARVELDDVDGDRTTAEAEDTAGRKARWLWLGATAGVLGIALGGFGTWTMLDQPELEPPRRVTRLSIQTPPHAPLTSSPIGVFAFGNAELSPDGSRVAYVATLPQGGTQLFVRALDESDVRLLAGTDGASAPFFSPDSESIGFFAGSKLKRVPAAGGTVITICDVPEDTGGSRAAWSPDGKSIVFAVSASARAGLSQVPAEGGAPEVLTQPDPREGGSHGDPSFIGNGQAVLFAKRWVNANVQPALLVRSLVTGEQHELVHGPVGRPLYLPTGHLVYLNQATLMAAPFDATQLQLTGKAVPVLQNVALGALSTSTDGLLAYTSPVPSTGRLVWVNRDGAIQPVLVDRHEFGRPRLSPDGNRLAVELYQEGKPDIGLYTFDNQALTRLTTGGANSPFWSPDGGRIIYRSGSDLLELAADGTGGAQALLRATDPGIEGAGFLAPGAWTPDKSSYIFVLQGSSGTAADIWALRVATEGGRRLEPLVQRDGNQWSVRVSPDGQWMSYADNESGQFEIYVQSLSPGGPRTQVSAGGGWQAVWHPSGGEIFYRSGNRMMAVTVNTTTPFSAKQPRELFSGAFASTDLANYDVTRDGQRFVMVQASDEAESRTIHLIDHWFDEVRRLVPVPEASAL